MSISILGESDESDNESTANLSSNTSDYFISRSGHVQWKKTPLPSTQTRQINIIRNAPGLPLHIRQKNFSSPTDVVRHIISKEFLQIIHLRTNEELYRNNPSDTPFTFEEIIGFIGVVFFAGVQKDSRLPISELWSKERGRPIYNATMSRNRVYLLLKNLRFDDRMTRSTRKANDKLAPIRELWELFLSKLKSSYIPGPYMTVDEMLTPFRGKCKFRQFMKSKPAKYGLKIWWLCDASSWYPFNGQVYLGREGHESRDVGQGKRVVIDLCRPIANSGRNICGDNFFSSLELCNELRQIKLSYVGTLRKNKPEIPSDFLPSRNREVSSSLFGHLNTTTLVSYVSKRNKAVVMISSMHFDNAVSADESHKPLMIQDYNAHKCGVDTMDKMVTMNSTRRATNRWPVKFFYTILDVAGIAAYVIYRKQFDSVQMNRNDRRRFLLTISEDLMREAIACRSVIRNIRIPEAEDLMNDFQRPSTSGNNSLVINRKRGRCCFCPQNLDRKHSHVCNGCERHVCKEHSIVSILCKNCL